MQTLRLRNLDSNELNIVLTKVSFELKKSPAPYMGNVMLLTGCDRLKLYLRQSVILLLTPNHLSLGESVQVCDFEIPLNLNNPIEAVFQNSSVGKMVVYFTNGYTIVVSFDPQSVVSSASIKALQPV